MRKDKSVLMGETILQMLVAKINTLAFTRSQRIILNLNTGTVESHKKIRLPGLEVRVYFMSGQNTRFIPKLSYWKTSIVLSNFFFQFYFPPVFKMGEQVSSR